MPELPEVETVVRELREAGFEGRVINRAEVYWSGIVQGGAQADFTARLRNRRVEAVSRRAKYIVIRLSGGLWLLVHLRMTGQFAFAAGGTPRDPHEHVVLHLDDGRELRFHDTRKFGRWRLVADPAQALGTLGPEPLEPSFTLDAFRKALKERHRQLKPLLLDQTFVAGLGNIYVDEALWDARLHPLRRADHLRPDEAKRLHAAIRRVLARAVRLRGTTLGHGQPNFYSVSRRRGRNQDALRVFRRQGEACPRCGRTLARIVVGQRSTHFCPACQPHPRGAARRAPAEIS